MEYLQRTSIPLILTFCFLILVFTAGGIQAGDKKFPASDEFVPVEQMPEIVKKVDPVYPPEAVKKKIEGAVFVRTLVDTDGKPVKSEIAKSSGYEILDDAALKTASMYEFKPALQNDQPVAVWISYKVDFNLSDKKQKEKTAEKDAFIEVEKMPELVYQPEPEYPVEAAEKGIEGVVGIKAYINKQGKPEKVKISKSSGQDILDQAALKSARDYRFKPAMNDGKAVGAWVEFNISFVL